MKNKLTGFIFLLFVFLFVVLVAKGWDFFSDFKEYQIRWIVVIILAAAFIVLHPKKSKK